MRNWQLWVVLALKLGLQASALQAADANPHPTSRFVVSRPDLPSTTLSLGKSKTAMLRGAEVHRYNVRLRAGQFASIEIVQTSGNIVAAVFDPHGKLIDLADRSGVGFPETLDVFAAETGDYAVQTAMFEWNTSKALYSINLARREPAGTTPNAIADQLLSSWYAPTRPGVAMAVIEGRRVVFQRTIGLADVEQRIPIGADTRFDLASVSKQFTAYGTAMLIDRGRIDLDDDVGRYLPELQLPEPIKIRHLLNHSSGLRDWDAAFGLIGRNIEDGLTKQQIVEWAAHQKELNFSPGSALAYSNTGYILLAEVIARVTGEAFSQWISTHVFEPAGMSAVVNDDAHAAIQKKANSYLQVLPPRLRSGLSTAVAGTGSMHASLNDLIAWVRNGDSGRVGNSKVLAMIGAPSRLDDGSKIDYGFGRWFSERKGVRYIGHLGLAAGYRILFRRYPERDLAFVYMTNDGNDATYSRAEIIEDLFLEIPPEPTEVPDGEFVPAQAQGPIPSIEAYQGLYYSDELRTAYEVRLRGEELVAYHAINGAIPLIHEASSRFRTEQWYMPSVEFERDQSSAIAGFRVSTEGARNMRFRRVGS